MAVFLELVTDAFDAKFGDVKERTYAGAGLTNVRRPLRGIEIKDDTYAYIKLVRPDNVEIPLIDSSSSGGRSKTYANFILQSVQEQRMERHQIVETFGDTYLFLFGESPRFLNITAMLINTLDFNWKAEFLANYEQYLRGTKAVEQGARTYLFYDQNIVEGYILNCQLSESADQPHVVPLSFQFFVTNSSNISLIETDQYPIRASANVPEGVELTDDLGGEALERLVQEGGIAPETALAMANREKPIRSLILDNKDEYTTGIQPSLMEIADERVGRLLAEQRQREQDKKEGVDNLESAVGDTLSAYGVDEDSSHDPFLMDELGIGPTFLPAGVGVGSAAGRSGATATFGATASAQAGAFAGGGAGIGAKASTGFSSFSGAFAGVSAGALGGASATAGFGVAGSSSSSVTTRTSVLSSTRFTAQTTSSIASFSSVTSRSMSGRVTALASLSAGARITAGASSSSFATTNTRAAARAGGYATSGAYLGFTGYGSFLGGSHAGAQGSAGASVSVGGKSSAFAFVTAKGTLQNVGVPPSVALQETQREYSWQKSWSWPTPN